MFNLQPELFSFFLYYFSTYDYREFWIVFCNNFVFLSFVGKNRCWYFVFFEWVMENHVNFFLPPKFKPQAARSEWWKMGASQMSKTFLWAPISILLKLWASSGGTRRHLDMWVELLENLQTWAREAAAIFTVVTSMLGIRTSWNFVTSPICLTWPQCLVRI